MKEQIEEMRKEVKSIHRFFWKMMTMNIWTNTLRMSFTTQATASRKRESGFIERTNLATHIMRVRYAIVKHVTRKTIALLAERR